MSWPKGIPSPKKGTKQPVLADKTKCRLTIPTPSGKQWPILFGPGATSFLMYVALHPGCKWEEIAQTLELKSYGAFSSRAQRLQRMGLIAMLRRRYQINPAIKQHLRIELVQLLRALGRAYGLCPGEKTKTITGPEIPHADRIDLPVNLFLTNYRTTILVSIAVLGETYRTELSSALGVDYRSAPTLLHSLLEEGVLRCRTVKRAKLYSLNPEYPGARHLEKLLRYIAGRTPTFRDAINYALVRRHHLRDNRRHDAIQGAVVMSDFSRSPNGVRMDVGAAADRHLRKGKGHKPIWQRAKA